jgi:hypothetical protein
MRVDHLDSLSTISFSHHPFLMFHPHGKAKSKPCRDFLTKAAFNFFSSSIKKDIISLILYLYQYYQKYIFCKTIFSACLFLSAVIPTLPINFPQITRSSSYVYAQISSSLCQRCFHRYGLHSQLNDISNVFRVKKKKP